MQRPKKSYRVKMVSWQDTERHGVTTREIIGEKYLTCTQAVSEAQAISHACFKTALSSYRQWTIDNYTFTNVMKAEVIE